MDGSVLVFAFVFLQGGKKGVDFRYRLQLFTNFIGGSLLSKFLHNFEEKSRIEHAENYQQMRYIIPIIYYIISQATLSNNFMNQN